MTPWRPHLLPAARWARIALVALLVFTMARGTLWGTTTPSLWGPDEDYHFMYVDTVSREGRIIDPARPLYSAEYSRTTDRTSFNAYGGGPRTTFEGDPKASLRVLELLPEPARRGTAIGRGIGVVHPPLYHAFGAAANGLAGDASLPTRMWWVRAVSALLGTIAVYGSWLLAAQVLRRRAVAPLLVGLLVATEPMLGYLSGLVNHDIGLTAFFTLACAQLAFMGRVAPAWRQGALAGVLIAAALLVKASAAVLLVLAGATLLLQALTYRRFRQAALSGAAALVAVGVLAGWWYVHSKLTYGSLSGVVIGEPAPTPAPAGAGAAGAAPPPRGYLDASLREYVLWTREWFGDWYRTTFFHFMNFEAPGGRWFYFVPGFALGFGLLATLALLLQRWRTLLDPARPLARQVAVMLLAMPLLVIPFLVTDFGQKLNGSGFLVNAGRYSLPAYAALVTALLAGVLWVFRRSARGVVGWALGAASAWFCFYVWDTHYVTRYFGAADFGEQLRRIAFDRPGFITTQSLEVWVAVTAGALLVFALSCAVGAREGRREEAAAVPGPEPVTEVGDRTRPTVAAT